MSNLSHATLRTRTTHHAHHAFYDTLLYRGEGARRSPDHSAVGASAGAMPLLKLLLLLRLPQRGWRLWCWCCCCCCCCCCCSRGPARVHLHASGCQNNPPSRRSFADGSETLGKASKRRRRPKKSGKVACKGQQERSGVGFCRSGHRKPSTAQWIR